MLVYGHRSFRLNLARFLATFLDRLEALPRTPWHDDVVDLLVDFGEAEAAFADFLCPREDDEHAELEEWRAAAHDLAAAFCASWHGGADEMRAPLRRCRTHVATLARTTPAIELSARTAEGFACYALFPEQYIVAAERAFADAHGQSLACIGLRSIGSTLAHVVAAAAERQGLRTDVRTLRPRGHPFERQMFLGDALRRVIGSWRDRDRIAIVDEGPGLSGSSFAAAAEALVAEGIPESRIMLFPSWTPDAQTLKSARARAAWQRYTKAVGRFEEEWLPAERGGPSSAIEDYSAGAWRSAVIGGDRAAWPAVQPQHERRKYRRIAAPYILRFAGLGRYGRTKLERARALADNGFGSACSGLEHGFLTLEWIDGVPLTLPSAAFIQRAAAYLAFVRRMFGTGEREDTTELRSMIATNVRRGVGEACARSVERLAGDWDQERVAVDGRMLPYEWIASENRLVKVDALDHHSDDFWPGCRDIAWDVAGTIVEFGLDRDPAGALVAKYQAAAGDRSIEDRLPFYTAAYLAYRLGYASLAADTLGAGPDAQAFRRLQAYYRRSLEALAAHPIRTRRR
jgi:hypothetical protein